MITFCLLKASHTGFNADDISPYSFAKDVISGISVTGWNFPAPTFIFPDVLASIPIVYLFKTPEIWFYICACIQWWVLISVIYAYTKKPIVGLIYVSIIVYEIGYYLLPVSWLPVATRMFVLVNHMSAAIMALAFYLLVVRAQKKSLSLVIASIMLALFFIGAFSDLFLVVYTFALIGAHVCVNIRQVFKCPRWILLVVSLGMAGLGGVFLNYELNPNFTVQLHHSYQPISFAHYVWMDVLLFLVIPLISIVILSLKKVKTEQNKLLLSLFLGCLFVLVSVVGTGMIADRAGLRYLDIYFPVYVLVVAILLPAVMYRFSMTLLASVIALLFSVNFYSSWMQSAPAFHQPSIKAVLDCPAFQQNREGALVVATYWPAKILFEKSDRVFFLKQTKDDLKTEYHWIYNPIWMEGVTHKTLYVTIEASQQAIMQIKKLPNAQVICGDSVILIDENKRK
jgi:hypothetical protein